MPSDGSLAYLRKAIDNLLLRDWVLRFYEPIDIA